MIFSHQEIEELVAQHGSPIYLYSRAWLQKRAASLLKLDLPHGLTVRFAIKANPHPEIIGLFANLGLHFDASSSYEATSLLRQGVPGNRISLSSQQPAHNLPELLANGVHYIVTSLHQLRLFAEAATPGAAVGLRVNPGVGAGHNNRTTTGGAAASFGLWHEYVGEALALANQHELTINRLHIHIGSGGDPKVWGSVIDTAIQIARQLPDVTILDIGGGFKVRRARGETETDMQQVGRIFAKKLRAFARHTGRQLHLEIEPGSWLAAHAGVLVSEIVDIVDTGPHGYTFLRTNTGMNDFMRPTLYGAQHEMQVLGQANAYANYVVVGHNCESGDILTPVSHDPEHIAPQRLNRATIGDLLVIADTGAYCASLRAHGYNAYPSAKEVVI